MQASSPDPTPAPASPCPVSREPVRQAAQGSSTQPARSDRDGLAAAIRATHFPVHTLGPGPRLVIWFQGCTLACRGCMSRHTWDPRGGERVSVHSLLERWREAVRSGAEGLTVSGGEPVEQPAALAALLDGAARIRDEAAHASGLDELRKPDILLYTGFTVEELTGERATAIRSADTLVTGRYDAAQPTDLVWRGSANQQMLPRTALGRHRYRQHVSRTLARSRLQLVDGGERVHIYGVPRRGELAAIERRLKPMGVHLDNVSWRP